MSTLTQNRAGGYDWLNVWREMYDVERAQGEAATDPAFERAADIWASRANRYAVASRRHPQPDAFMAALTPHLRPTDRVLDVGAGTGRYLPYLAAHVAEVIAVEPSSAMRSQLEQTVRELALTNVQLIADHWPPAQLPRADVVLSAHVVYGVREIGPFLMALNQAATRLCALYLGLEHPTSALAPFWSRVHGEVRRSLPGALEAVAVCHQLGLPARLDLLPAPEAFRFANSTEALEEIRIRLRLTPEPTRDAVILAAMTELLVPVADGQLVPRAQPRYNGLVWWYPEPIAPVGTAAG